MPGIGDATVELLEYSETSWTGEQARQEKIFPAWILAENHPLVRGMSDAVAEVTGSAPRISRWGFSTNGVATMGRHGIPSAGFAPGPLLTLVISETLRHGIRAEGVSKGDFELFGSISSYPYSKLVKNERPH